MRVSVPQSLLVIVTHSDAGGAQELCVNLVEGFRARGFNAELMALYPSKTRQDTPADIDWHHVVQRRPASPWSALRLLWRLVAELRRRRTDVIFTALPAANVVVPVAATLAGGHSRVVISHHSQLEGQTPALERIDAWTGRLPVVSDVVAVSRAVSASRKRSAAYRAKQQIVMNALPPDIEAWVSELAMRRADRPRGRRVVTNGRLVPVKNHPLLVHAAQHLRDAEFEITGGGPDEAALRALATKLGVEERVHFPGHVSRREALARLAMGDIFTQVSFFEGHSLALIEAAKIGLPLIVSDIPVQRESVTAADGTLCGQIVRTDDDRGLAEEIRRLLDDDDAYDRAVALSRKLGEELCFSHMMDRYQALVRARPGTSAPA